MFEKRQPGHLASIASQVSASGAGTLCTFACRYADALLILGRFKEAKSLMRKTIHAARRSLGEGYRLTLKMRSLYALSLYGDPGATLDDLREAVTTLEDAERISRRVFGGAHPTARAIEIALRTARAALRARETPPPGALAEEVD